ncbi:nucleoside phosphatase family-domain-containing protein [Mycena rebaudengoi]|nr:nucleoside phosphatase family-domain-containing protein [Mycena rebaudengoi]
MAPASPTYDRIEAGPPASSKTAGKTSNSTRFRWKRTALATVVLLGFLWLFVPKENRPEIYVPGWGAKDALDNESISAQEIKPTTQPIPTEESKPNKIADINDKPTTYPTNEPPALSFATDPDRSKTIYCTTPHSGSRLVQYALMLEAGSTGSRIHIYKFNNCGPSPAYEYEVFRQVWPSLSAFSGRPTDAATSLDELLDSALEVVPEALRACTPVQVKATAGLRLLPGGQSTDILAAVEARLRARYPFAVPETGAVTILDGKDEGVYEWIAANYLLGTVGANPPRDASTYAVLDLGGASTQIVFEPTFAKADESLVDGEHKYDLEFAGRTRVLYQHSYLGYGLMHARQHVHRLVLTMAAKRAPLPVTEAIRNPCLARGTRKLVTVLADDGDWKSRNEVTMDGGEVGAFDACARVMQNILAKDALCMVKPCAFNGVYQPSLLDAFPAASGRVLLLSYFYDRVAPLVPAAAAGNAMTVDGIADLARAVCSGHSVWTERWGNQRGVMEELEGRPEYCLDLTFMHSLLRLGYEFEGTRDVVFGKMVHGTELGWSFGAALALLDGELRCRI